METDLILPILALAVANGVGVGLTIVAGRGLVKADAGLLMAALAWPFTLAMFCTVNGLSWVANWWDNR